MFLCSYMIFVMGPISKLIETLSLTNIIMLMHIPFFQKGLVIVFLDSFSFDLLMIRLFYQVYYYFNFNILKLIYQRLNNYSVESINI